LLAYVLWFIHGCICTHICTHPYVMCVCVRVCGHVLPTRSLASPRNIGMCVRAHVYTYTYMHQHVCVCICLSISMSTSMCPPHMQMRHVTHIGCSKHREQTKIFTPPLYLASSCHHLVPNHLLTITHAQSYTDVHIRTHAHAHTHTHTHTHTYAHTHNFTYLHIAHTCTPIHTRM